VTESREDTMTPARKALLAFAKAWTYPILGNEDVPVTNRLLRKLVRCRGVLPRARPTRPNSRGGWRFSAMNRATAPMSGRIRCTRSRIISGSRPTIDGGKFHGGMSGGRRWSSLSQRPPSLPPWRVRRQKTRLAEYFEIFYNWHYVVWPSCA
jgi:hypothetical protein